MGELSRRILQVLEDGPATARDVCDAMEWPVDRDNVRRAAGMLSYLLGKGTVQKVGSVRSTCVKNDREQLTAPSALYGLVTK